jgi:hypothetical protein
MRLAPEALTSEERRELREADRLHQAEQQQRDAELRRRGFPKTLPCLRCERPRTATAPDDRMHASCDTRGVAFTPAEHQRINKYLATVEPEPKPKPKRERMPAAPREKKPFTWPTEAEVAALTVKKRCALRHRYKQHGIPLPAYLTPMKPSESGALGTPALMAKRAAARAA